jgi:hypothetical protein
MDIHYSRPGGFVGRNRCFAITYNNDYYGHIVGGSATRFLPGRDEFFGIKDRDSELVHIINNIFYHIRPANEKYPEYNFTTKVVSKWRKVATRDWENYYGDEVWGFETLIELPRKGTLYRKDGWKEVGQTKGYTCKRIGGNGTDNWSGKRVWDTKNLKPKLVLVKGV